MARNQRLYDAIRRAGKRPDDIAREVDADPKTVARWITVGRLPRPHIRQQVAQLLGVPEAVLWPSAPGVAYGTSELVGLYATRRELPPSTVSALLDQAERHIDVLGYAALWLWDTVPQFAERVQLKIAQGARVRICLGDPDSSALRTRGEEEGIGDGLAARCRIAVAYARPIHQADPRSVRLTAATLYASIVRLDNQLLLNSHLYGNPASDSPVLHLRLEQPQGIAANVLRSFERVWDSAQALLDEA